MNSAEWVYNKAYEAGFFDGWNDGYMEGIGKVSEIVSGMIELVENGEMTLSNVKRFVDATSIYGGNR